MDRGAGDKRALGSRKQDDAQMVGHRRHPLNPPTELDAATLDERLDKSETLASSSRGEFTGSQRLRHGGRT
jgi:hypothetical protein